MGSDPCERYFLRKFLGCGTWGNVYLAQRRSDSGLFALKIIHHWWSSNQVESLILSTISHPFIVSCVDSFIAKQKQHLCLEYVAGGDLAYHISRRGPFHLKEAKLIVAQISLALEALHARQIVYRDLKPENVLVGCDGFVKLTDFGLCAAVSGCTRVCGTYEYLAPETLSGQSYGAGVDWWALGIVFFEMLFGRTPFFAVDRVRMRDKIVGCPVIIPDHSGGAAVGAVLSGLLEKDPTLRYGFAELRNSALFGDVDFDAVFEKRIDPPFFPDEFDPGRCVAKTFAAMRLWRSSYDTGDSSVENGWQERAKRSAEWSALACERRAAVNKLF
jgi:serine/threonine protein kinase